MAILKVITVEWRKPVTTEERKCFGVTVTEGELAKIFINESINGQAEEIDTFFHEVAHAYMHFHPSKRTEKQQERVAESIGKAAKGLMS